MRKLSKKNKISFNIFGLIIVMVIGLLSFISFQVLAYEKEEYSLKKGSTLYDNHMSLIDVVSDGIIEKKWTGEYYASLDDVGDYNLGSHSVIFDGSSRVVMILGDGYQVFTDGTVNAIEKKTDISDLREMKLYKLEDRKYLIIGNQITSKDNSVSTTRYLMVTMDKSGNALLSNDETNFKTVKPLILMCDNVEFDIANEKLNYQDQVVDLKKISGSTNQYVPPVEEKGDDQSQDNQDTPSSIVGGTGGIGGTGGSSNGTGGSTNSGGGSLTNGDDNQSDNGGTTTTPTTPNADTKPKNLERSISIRGTSTTVNSITIDYSIVDVENKFVATYIILEDLENETETRFGVNKADSSITLRSLAPNSQYKVYLKYEMYMLDKDKINTLTENTAGVIKVRTKNIQCSVNVDRITSQKVHFTVNTDEKFILDSASLTLYVDGIKKSSQVVDITKSIKGGWTGSFDVDGGTTFKLAIENAMYNGDSIKLNAQCTSKVSNNTESFIQSILDWFK